MGGPRPVTEAELHAFVDGALDPADTERVSAWLREHEEDARSVRAWREDVTLLRAAYADVAVPSVPLAQTRAPRRLSWAAAASVAVIAFGLGTGAGYLSADRTTSGKALPPWAGASVSAHKVYVSEVRHPVEVPATEREHLVGWLSKRMDAVIKVPDLSEEGLRLLGGRLLPYEGMPSAMLMYEDEAGNRFSVFAVRSGGAPETAFRVWEQGGVSAVYWIDGALGYILVGDSDRRRLIELAHAVHQSLT